MHEHASKMKLGDKETVAICIQASVTCYLHVIHRYTRMVRTIRVWSYRTRMVYKIVLYAYGTYHTRMVCTVRVWYKIRVWYRTCTFRDLLRNPIIWTRSLSTRLTG